MNARPITTTAALLLGLAGAAACPAQEAPAVVPFQMLPSNHMMVEAKLNGAGPFRLIFDLGSPVILLSNRAAEASKALPKKAPRSILFGMRGEGEVDSLSVGTLEAKDLPVIVMDHPALKALSSALGKPLDGIIGYTFFARYRTTIDYQKHEMTFTPVNTKVRNLLEDLPARMMGPKEAKTRTVAPSGVWGLEVGEPTEGVASRGVPVTAVLAGSPAAAAGLQAGDVLTSLDGRWTTTRADTFEAAAGCPADRAVPVVVLRDGREVTLSVTPRDGL